MRLIKLFLILAVSVSLMSCIKRTVKNNGLNSNMIESLDGPRVIRDTIIKEIIIEKEVEPAIDIVQQQVEQPKTTARTSSTSASSSSRYEDRNDNYDRGNSGFFDEYQSTYTGDPNRNKKPITRIVDDGADDIDRKKEAIAKSLNVLEKRNQQQQQEYELMEKERQAANARAIEKAKQEQRNQQQKPKPKTLDTDLLLNNR